MKKEQEDETCGTEHRFWVLGLCFLPHITDTSETAAQGHSAESEREAGWWAPVTPTGALQAWMLAVGVCEWLGALGFP